MLNGEQGLLDDPLFILVSGLIVFFATVGLIVALLIAMRPRMKLRSRMADLGLVEARRSSRAVKLRDPEQRRIQERLRELEAQGKKRRRKFQFRSSIERAGLDIGYQGYILASILIGMASALPCLLLGYPMLVVVSVGAAGGLILPRLILGLLTRRRLTAFTREFPSAIDILVRGVRSGLPVNECLEIIGREMPEPVSEEFRRLVEGQKMGITLEQILVRAIERVPTAEFKFFAIVIQVQQQIGGSLADTMENLSHVLRERKKMRDKAVAMASEGKTSATIIGSIPFILALILSVINPEYMSPFFATLLGQTLFYSGLIWMGLGVLVMRRMINFNI